MRTLAIFPAFEPTRYVGNDVAVLEMERSSLLPGVSLGPPGHPLGGRLGSPATAVGWGAPSSAGIHSLEPAKVPLPSSQRGLQQLRADAVSPLTFLRRDPGTTQSILQTRQRGPAPGGCPEPVDPGGITSFGTTCQPRGASPGSSAFLPYWIQRQVPAGAVAGLTVDWAGGDSVRGTSATSVRGGGGASPPRRYRLSPYPETPRSSYS